MCQHEDLCYRKLWRLRSHHRLGRHRNLCRQVGLVGLNTWRNLDLWVEDMHSQRKLKKVLWCQAKVSGIKRAFCVIYRWTIIINIACNALKRTVPVDMVYTVRCIQTKKKIWYSSKFNLDGFITLV